jgi:hypothetical protein
MIFDWTISLGNILTVLGFGISGVIFVMMIRNDTNLLGQRITSVERVLDKLAETASGLIRQPGRVDALDDRLGMVSKRLDDLINRNTRH